MLVKDILKIKGRTDIQHRPGGTAATAVSLMVEHDIGSLVVMERGQDDRGC